MKEESIKLASERLLDLLLDMGGRLYLTNARRAVRGFLEIEKIGDANFQAVIMQGVLDKVLRVEGSEILAVLPRDMVPEGESDNDDVTPEEVAPAPVVMAPVAEPPSTNTMGQMLLEYYAHQVQGEQSPSDKKYARLAMARLAPMLMQRPVPGTIEEAINVMTDRLYQGGMTGASAKQYARSLRPYLELARTHGGYFLG